ncbi:translocation/assembly module TamB domain-containing protein [Profundibacterium mesophilum]|uniref:Translocation and assembly module TamB C-terminal domain-containing protein n=1 Tax=Profundibacterium mesophilum KAUST100406-0324 TaxID=1037889 RepID=A0A921P137_9RHOB|nr:translocation/assembly module TamB domain-containing protein [Profundibacterium mesophilum]KAF0677273.1 hypothetical protein PMES_00320 [Profundibacterium mesophilum KAUST100406-0324]
MHRFLVLLTAIFMLALPVHAQDDEDDGGGFLERQIEKALSGPGFDVRIRGFEGALSSRATIETLVISDDEGAWLTLEDAVLDWNRSALLRGRLEVEELSAVRLSIPRLANADPSAPAPEATPFSLPDLPVSVRIEKLAIDRVELGEPILGRPAVVTLAGAASLDDGEGEVSINAERLDGDLGTLTLAGSYANDDKVLTLDLSLVEGPNGIVASLADLPGRPALTAEIKGSGPLSDFEAALTLETDGEPRIAGTVTLKEDADGGARRFAADISGDIAPVFSPTYRPFFGPDISLRAAGAQFPDGRLVLDDFSLAAQSLLLEGSAALGADKVPERFALTGRIAGEDGPVLLPFGAGDTRVRQVILDLGFDASQGEAWSGEVVISELQQNDLEIEELRLDGAGVISQDDTLAVTANFDFIADGLSLDDGGLQQALGRRTQGRAEIAWVSGTPVQLGQLVLDGASYRLEGQGQLDPAGEGIPAALTATLEAEDLAPFSGLAGRPISGGLTADLSLEAAVLNGAFDVALTGTGRDLILSIPQIDGLLEGETQLVLRADRDETGTRLEQLTLDGAHVELTANADLKSEASEARAELAIAELSRMDRALSGPGRVVLTARQEAEIWQVALEGSGAGATVSGSGTAGQFDSTPLITGTVTLDAEDLARFSGLADRRLGGSVALSLAGSARTDLSALDLTAEGTARDLRIGQAELDRLMGGETVLDLAATKAGKEITLSRLSLENPQITASGEGRYAPASGAVDARIRLSELGEIMPELSGPGTLELDASGADGIWTVVLDGAGAGITLAADVDVEGLDQPVQRVTGDVAIRAEEIAPFARLAGRPIAGGIALTIDGTATTDAMSIDASVEGSLRDLQIGQEDIDRLLAGQTAIDAQLTREGSQFGAPRLRVENPQMSLAGGGTYSPENGQAELQLTLAELGDVVPELSGPARLVLDAQGEDGVWQAVLEGEGADVVLNADVAIEGLAEEVQSLAGRASFSAADLSRFERLAQRPLGGALSLDIEGSGNSDLAELTVTANGEARDLSLGQPDLDRLLAGTTTIALETAKSGDEITLPRARIENPQISVAGEGRYSPQNGAVTAQVAVAELGAIVPELSGPATVTLDASGEGGLWTVLLDGEGAGITLAADTELTDLDQSAFTIGGTAALGAADLARFSRIAGRDLAGSVQLALEGSATSDFARAELDAEGTLRDLAVGQAELDRLLDGTTAMTARMRKSGDEIFLPRLRIANPRLQVNGEGRYAPEQGQLRADLRLSELSQIVPELSGEAVAEINAVGQDGVWNVVLDGRGADVALDADLELRGLDREVQSLSGTAQLAAAELGRFSGLAGRELGGAITLSIEGSGTSDAARADLSFSGEAQDLAIGIAQADALLAGRTVLSGEVMKLGSVIDIPALSLRNPQMELSAEGRYGDGGALEAQLRLTEIGQLAAGLSGAATAEIVAEEIGAAWQVTLDAAGAGAMVAASAEISDIAGGTPLIEGDARVEAADLGRFSGLAGRRLGGSLEAQASGGLRTDLSRFDVDLSARTRGLSAGLGTADGLLGGQMTLAASASRDAAGDPIRLERLSLDGSQLTATADGTILGGASDLDFAVRIANIAPFAAGISGPARVAGSLREAGSGLALDIEGTGPGGVALAVDGTLARDFSTAALDASGQVPLGLANTVLMPRSLNGTARFDVSLDGPLALSSLSGEISTSGARFVDPGLQAVLEDLALTARIANSRVVLDGSARKDEGGRVTVSGPITLLGGFDADLRIALQQFVVEDPELYRTIVDGTVAIEGPLAGGARIGGTLVLGQTDLRIPSTGLGATGPIPDGITHVSEPEAVRATRRRAGLIEDGSEDGASDGGGTRVAYPLDLRIIAENQIFIRGRGLDAELGGQLTLQGTTANVIPAGQFDLIRGRIDLLGKRLVLDEGQVTLQGDFTPFIRFVVRTDTGDVTVLIVVEGPALSPDIDFLSEPELPEDEVLARLLFGRSIESISALQAAQLASAVATLAGRGGDGVIGKLRQNFGLDDLDVTTDEEGNVGLRAGKYISENVYSDVAVGSEGDAEINLNLDLTPSLTVKGGASSSGETSLGIFFEKDY